VQHRVGCFTDTDSFCYHIECEDLYTDMKRDGERFNLSNYPAEQAWASSCLAACCRPLCR
jgi:hypothetical protein